VCHTKATPVEIEAAMLTTSPSYGACAQPVDACYPTNLRPPKDTAGIRLPQLAEVHVSDSHPLGIVNLTICMHQIRWPTGQASAAPLTPRDCGTSAVAL